MKFVGENITIDGEKTLLVSGSMHYFRTLPEQWEDRLEKIAAAGLNCVETYVPWNLHEPQEGVYNFDGMLDLSKFLELAEKKGLYVILRPSPYICAECEFGGLPSWLLKYPSIRLRTMDKVYIEKIERYYDKLVPVFKPYLKSNGGNIIALQIENEYGSYGNDSNYLEYLKNTLVERGVNEVLFTSDGPSHYMLNGGTLPDVWKTINFGSKAKESFEILKKHQPCKPKMVMEFWIGWFDHWEYQHITRKAKDIEQDLIYMLENDISINFYMFHGGTNFGFMNGANYQDGQRCKVTSYDYDAILTESGDLTEKYYLIKNTLKKYEQKIKKHKNHKYYTIKDSLKANYGNIRFNEFGSLKENIELISKYFVSPYTLTMEELDQDYGFILYKTVIKGQMEELKLSIQDVRDRALIYLNGKYKGIIDRNNKQEILLKFEETESTLEILVENMGRINYGSFLKDKKGITEGVKIGNQFLFNWEIYTIPLKNIVNVKFTNSKNDEYPAFYRGNFTVDKLGDTYLDFTGWDKGIIFINGFNIGRYWKAGPQKRLYVPASLLKVGDNEIVVFELHNPGNLMTLVDKPKLS